MKNPVLKKSKVIAKSSEIFLKQFAKWVIISIIIGCIGGLVGTAFYFAVSKSNEIRIRHPLLMLLMPVGGVLIVAMYKICKMYDNHGTDDIIDSVRTDENIPLRTGVLIFISTVITHFVGGSAGREGAALQLGGSIGYQVGRLFKMHPKDRHILVMCGMSALFSALFGTPLTATVFALEVIAVGEIYYSGLVPCMLSALVAYSITLMFGITPTFFDIANIPAVTTVSIGYTAFVAMLCGGLSIVFCLMLHGTAKQLKKFFKNPYIRILVGSAIILLLTFALRTTDYNGAGTAIIADAVNGNVKYEAFLLKMIFTAVTIGAGFKGGEIVPTFFVGATFGAAVGRLVGLDVGFCAAVGMTAMFCGMLNCPFASIILSMELFGEKGMLLFAVAAAVSYVLSGNYGLYHSQKIVYSKIRAEYINKNTK